MASAPVAGPGLPDTGVLRPPRITLLTDFGTADGYVAAIKAVIASIAPASAVDDASHDIDPGDIAGAAWALGAYWDLYPPGTVHLVVVDPGVGSSRRPIVLEADGRFFTGPDNGVFSHVLRGASRWRGRIISSPGWARPELSSTFHGRDVFAPAAARLASGHPLQEAGEELRDPIVLEWRHPERAGARITGEVVHVDRFGNMITNVPAEWLAPGSTVRVMGRKLPVRGTYADAEDGELLAVVGSRGVVEIAVRNGSAARRLGPAGTPVEVTGGHAPD